MIYRFFCTFHNPLHDGKNCIYEKVFGKVLYIVLEGHLDSVMEELVNQELATCTKEKKSPISHRKEMVVSDEPKARLQASADDYLLPFFAIWYIHGYYAPSVIILP